MAFFRKTKQEQQEDGVPYADGLPEMCYSFLPGPKYLIYIRRGSGSFGIAGRQDDKGDNIRLANELNRKMGVTEAQRRAMEAGLIYGWDSPMANPQYYDPQPEPRMGGMSL